MDYNEIMKVFKKGDKSEIKKLIDTYPDFCIHGFVFPCWLFFNYYI